MGHEDFLKIASKPQYRQHTRAGEVVELTLGAESAGHAEAAHGKAGLG